MEKQSTLRKYVLPFVRVNTLMIVGWIIGIVLFRESGVEIPACMSRRYFILVLFGINAFIYFMWIYCPYFSHLYRHSERNDNIGLPLASLGMALCMFMFAKGEYLYTTLLYFGSTALFMIFLYWDLYKIRRRKAKKEKKWPDKGSKRMQNPKM